MDLKRLKYFCIVVETGSVTRAAELLHMSQPPLSKRLQELEDEVGTPLLIRSAQKITPSQTGFFLYEQAVKILKEVDELEKAITSIAQH
ncbi:LysR family transcriptional regulator [Actinobacillus vicugnae]|uniref:LysR family transcriptional regulator n=1 Tax=Actinobacillus vicugnae TaxID=2573093 RepID=UPI0012419108|nr:LysR family transcriptional regulator [Actinobacillus vicugnae]